MSRGNRQWNVSTGDRGKSCSTSYTVGVKNTVLVPVRVFSFKGAQLELLWHQL